MENLTENFFFALALVMIGEGLIYALFPKQLQKMMAIAATMNPEKLRSYGGLLLASGAVFLWLIL